MMRHTLLMTTCVSTLLFLMACDSPPQVASPVEPKDSVVAAHDRAEEGVAAKETAPVPGADKKPEYHYSPFVLKVSSPNSAFKKISFKDVGLRHLDKDQATRHGFYETMAESLAYELQMNEELDMSASRVIYDEAIVDPANHLACGSNHLYVDVWRSAEPTRWGYSLWSGCGEEDNFEWREVEFEPATDGDVIKDVSTLSKSIMESLEQADARGCYQKAC